MRQLLLILAIISPPTYAIASCNGTAVQHPIFIYDDDYQQPMLESPLQLSFQAEPIEQSFLALSDHPNSEIQALLRVFRLMQDGQTEAYLGNVVLGEPPLRSKDQALVLVELFRDQHDFQSLTLVAQICLEDRAYFVLRNEKTSGGVFSVSYIRSSKKFDMFHYHDALASLVDQTFAHNMESEPVSPGGFHIESHIFGDGIRLHGPRKFDATRDKDLLATLTMLDRSAPRERTDDISEYKTLLGPRSLAFLEREIENNYGYWGRIPGEFNPLLVARNGDVSLVFYGGFQSSVLVDKPITPENFPLFLALQLTPNLLIFKDSANYFIDMSGGSILHKFVQNRMFYQSVIVPGLIRR